MWQRLATGRLPVLLVALIFIPAQAAVAGSVSCILAAACPGATHEGGGVAIHVRCSTATGGFQSLDLLALKRDGIAAAPVIAPLRIGLDSISVPAAEELIFFWETAPGDAGSWEICFEGLNDLGDADTCCHTVDVNVLDPYHFAWHSRHIQFVPGGVSVAVDMLLGITIADSIVSGVLPFTTRSRSGGAFFSKPVIDSTDGAGARGDPVGHLRFAAAFGPVFLSKHTNTFGNDGVSPDSFMGSLITFGDALPPGTYPDAMTVFADIATVEGIIAIDTSTFPQVSEIYFGRPGGQLVYPTYSAGCFAVTIGHACPVGLTGDVNDNGTITSADIISMVGTVFKSDFRFTRCYAQGDVNCDGLLNAADIIHTVNIVFKSGPPLCNVCPLIWNGIWECE